MLSMRQNTFIYAFKCVCVCVCLCVYVYVCVCMCVYVCVCVCVCVLMYVDKVQFYVPSKVKARHLHPSLSFVHNSSMIPFFSNTELSCDVRTVGVLRWVGLQSESVCSAFTHISKAKAFISSYTSSSSSSTSTSATYER